MGRGRGPAAGAGAAGSARSNRRVRPTAAIVRACLCTSRCATVAARRRRSGRDRRRRNYGQNLLVDTRVVDRLLARLDLGGDELVVEVGAGRGALTIPLAAAGAKVLAIERDGRFVAALQRRIEAEGVARRVQIRKADFRTLDWPRRRFQVVAAPPYGLTTDLLTQLLDDPTTGPERADLLLQLEVARKRAHEPASTLKSAGWAPWWHFELGETVDRQSFRPVPAIDSAWLTIHRRDPPILPSALAGGFRELLRPAWQQLAEQRTETR